VAHGISVKFGLWTFQIPLERQKIFDFIDLWLPNSSHMMSWWSYLAKQVLHLKLHWNF